MTKQLKAFGSGDVEVLFNLIIDGDDIFLNDDTSFVAPVTRLVFEVDTLGNAHGIFELGTELYDNQHKNVFEDVMRDETEMDIIVSPRRLNCTDLSIDPLTICENCSIDLKRTTITAPCDVVHTQYYFSNHSVDWKEIKMELPIEHSEMSFNPDPLFKIARALDGIKKLMPDKKEERVSEDNLVFTIEEFTEYILNGKLPVKYQNKVF